MAKTKEAAGGKDSKKGNNNKALLKYFGLGLAVLVAAAIIGSFVSPPTKKERPAKKGVSEGGNNNNNGFVSCEVSRQVAEEAMEHENYKVAVEELIKCANSNHSDAANHWNVGVLLYRMQLYEDALSWMEQSARLDNTSITYFVGAGTAASKLGNETRSIPYLEAAMTLLLRLDPGTWRTTLFNSARQTKDEDIAWLKDADPQTLPVLRMLLSAYLKAHYISLSESVFHLLVRVEPSDTDLRAQFADFSFSIGYLKQGHELLLENLLYKYNKAMPDQDAYEPIMGNSLRLLTAGMHSSVVHLARGILSSKHESTGELDVIGGLCGVNMSYFAASNILLRKDLVHLYTECLAEQKLIPDIISRNASLHNGNLYGFTPLHNAAAIGNSSLLAAIVAGNPRIDAENNLGQTPLHIAVLSHNVDAVSFLLMHGADLAHKDRFGRNVHDVACLAHVDLTAVTDMSGHPCPNTTHSFSESDRSSPVATTGEWRGLFPEHVSSSLLQECGIDVRYNLTAEQFFGEYLTLGKPVLIRGALLEDPHYSKLMKRWTRGGFLKEHGSLSVNVSTIPYASSFGYPMLSATINQYYTYLDDASKNKANSSSRPLYVFESLSPSSPLSKDFALPAVVDATVTQLETRTMQFYLGPEGSGAPVHFHSGAWNALVHGGKHWALMPPSSALYSTYPAHVFFNHSLPLIKKDQVVLECFQRSGDVMYVPEGWGHAVLNVQESIGFASEFLFGGAEFSI